MTSAIILAAGKGNRLSPVTDQLPKPFLPLGSGTIFGRLVGQLTQVREVSEIFVNTHHLPDIAVEEISRTSSSVPLTVRYEPRLRGPAGSLHTFADQLAGSSAVVVTSGDIVFDGSIEDMVDFHIRSGAELTVASTEVADAGRFGVFELSEDGSARSLVEKPSWAKGRPGVVSAGLYVLSPSLLATIPVDVPQDFGEHLIPRMLREGRHVNLWPIPGRWDDLGDLETYRRVALSLAVAPDPSSRIHRRARLKGTVHVSKGVRIDAEASVVDSVLLPGARVGRRMIVANAVLGRMR